MKKSAKLILFFVFLFSLSSNTLVFAKEHNVPIYYNGTALSFETEPEIINGVTVVPMRAIFEAMGFEIHWQASTQTITGFKDQNIIQLEIGSNKVFQNGNEILLSVSPIIHNGYTLVPLRFVAESSGSVVDWNDDTHTINIYSQSYAENILKQIYLSEFDVEKIKESVVTIRTGICQGSGVVLTSSGYIVTNFHVLEGASKISVLFSNGTTYTGNSYIAGYDSVNDIVIFKIDASNLPCAVMGNSNDIRQNDKITAIGSPNGNPNTITHGNVNFKDDYTISASALIDHGSSGGGLFNTYGEVIGITSSMDSNGCSMAIPINIVANLELGEHIDISDWKNITPQLAPPDFISFVSMGDSMRISWSSVYCAEGYRIYISSSEDGNYVPLVDDVDLWNWGFPYSVEINANDGSDLYIKIASVKGDTASKLSEPVKLQH